MGEARRFSVRTMRLAGLLLAATALSACVDGLMTGEKLAETPQAGAETPTRAARGDQKDVEAPNVFSVSEAGLWDGRPSLGGVWVAHPDVTTPERVLIRNSANGKSVTGALFRRERDIPGPRLQASSDAAAALGMLGGAPVKLSVVALRREEAAPKVEPTPAAKPDAPDDAVVAGAETAIDGAATEGSDAPAAKEPFFKRVFGRKPAAEPEAPLAGSSQPVQAAPAVAVSALPAASTPAPAPAPAPAAGTAAESSAAAPVAEAAPVARKPLFGGLFKTKPQEVGEPLSALAPAGTTTAAAPVIRPPDRDPVVRSSKLAQPFIQIGTFADEVNAQRTADKLRKSGMVPTVKTEAAGNRKLWRVLVGPATSARERDTLLQQVHSSGFNDAYAVTK